MVALGGACVVLFGGHAWFYLGGAWLRGGAWFYLGGMRGFIRGACVVLFGGACVVFSVFADTMRYSQSAGGTHPTGMHSCLTVQCHTSQQTVNTHLIFFGRWGVGVNICLKSFEKL